ncbi:MAG: hypothetical protein AB7M12_07935 [Hyphomonadaceae bacterium]
MALKTILLILSLGGLLIASLWGVGSFFAAYGHEVSVIGWVAIIAGTLVSVGLGAGLMALSFYSAHRGYDDAAQWRDESDPEEKA